MSAKTAVETLSPGELQTFEEAIGDAERDRLRSAVSGLSLLSPTRSLAALTLDWGLICGAIALGTSAQSIFVDGLCIFIIGSRQHALLLLMHDAAHRRLHPNPRWNEWLSDVFCAFPLFVTTATYRRSHFAHHRHTNTSEDPDWRPRQGQDEWRFPKSRTEMAVLLLRQISGLNAGGMLAKAFRFSKTGPRETRSSSSGRYRPGLRIGFYALAAAVFTYFGVWTQFLLFWLLPIATSLAFLMRIRSISEHFGLGHTDELSSARNVVPGLLERLFLGLHNSHLHLDHHLYPSVPFYNLTRLHRELLLNEHYRRNAKSTLSYVSRPRSSLWSELVRPVALG